MKSLWQKAKKYFLAFMDFEKAYNIIDRDGLWNALPLYGLSGRQLKGVKSSLRSW